MEKVERDALIARYAEGPEVVATAFAAVPPDRIDVTVIPGEWTPRQIVHHVADSETNAYLRVRRLLAEDQPVITGYDQEEYARKLHYDRPVEASLAVTRAVRAATVQLLATLSEEEWAREGTHSESGRYTMDDWLRTYAAHCHLHAAQIRKSAGLAPLT
jgi:hypothetical protein